ncbi:MAG TPA: DinB family protein, partial [Chitinophagaceae bacterium]|nr:DinB family protein [Chitinophagaceae bacterium]
MVPITPWVQRSFQFEFPIGLFPVIFSRLEGTGFRLHHLTSNANEDFCSSAQNGWSVKQHIGHLTDLEELWWKRLKDFEQNKPVLTAADMTNTKTQQANHNERSLHELLHEFNNERKKITEHIYSFDKAMLAKTSLHPRLNKPMRLIDSLYFVAEHDD